MSSDIWETMAYNQDIDYKRIGIKGDSSKKNPKNLTIVIQKY